MKVAIVGYGVEGRASAEYFANRGHSVTVCDKNPETVVSDGFAKQLGEKYLDNLGTYDLIVRSAGIHPNVILSHDSSVKDKITTGINEFLAQAPTQNVIGITGTKGKGTTSTLTTKILEAHGHKAWLGGNIGRSPLEFIDETGKDDWVVLELSSFQLYDIEHSPKIAVCLMVVPEHLDWHENLEDYYAAKANLFRHQKRDDVAIYFADNPESLRIASHSGGRITPYFSDPGAKVCEHDMIEIEGSTKICHVNELKLLGEHNWQNVCAAITVAWQAGCQSPESIKQIVTSFTGLPHRLEPVGKVQDISFYNDSFAATPDAAIAAMHAIPGAKTMIVGGYDRKLPLENLAKALASENEVKLLLVGEGGRRLASVYEKFGGKHHSVSSAKDMKSIVAEAVELSSPGDAIVLSPGFASFDMFRNFEDRGNQFKEVVSHL